MGDLGNFTQDYVAAFKTGIQQPIDCATWDWSSRNNHIGRLLAVPELAATLAKTAETLSANDKVLMIGHSHAGQVFALLTVFLEESEKADKLLNILDAVDGFDKQAFSENIEKISGIPLDIVTLGAPVRYPWGGNGKFRLLNIVNHRDSATAFSVKGVLETRGGDYVQQWGTDGTDLKPSTNASLNDKLDAILDKGRPIDVGKKLQEIERRQPKKINGEEAGNSLFVDYLDQGSLVFRVFGKVFGKPNCMETLFGHGVYTRQNSMLFNTQLIVDKYYTL